MHLIDNYCHAFSVLGIYANLKNVVRSSAAAAFLCMVRIGTRVVQLHSVYIGGVVGRGGGIVRFYEVLLMKLEVSNEN